MSVSSSSSLCLSFLNNKTGMPTMPPASKEDRGNSMTITARRARPSVLRLSQGDPRGSGRRQQTTWRVHPHAGVLWSAASYFFLPSFPATPVLCPPLVTSALLLLWASLSPDPCGLLPSRRKASLQHSKCVGCPSAPLPRKSIVPTPRGNSALARGPLGSAGDGGRMDAGPHPDSRAPGNGGTCRSCTARGSARGLGGRLSSPQQPGDRRSGPGGPWRHVTRPLQTSLPRRSPLCGFSGAGPPPFEHLQVRGAHCPVSTCLPGTAFPVSLLLGDAVPQGARGKTRSPGGEGGVFLRLHTDGLPPSQPDRHSGPWHSLIPQGLCLPGCGDLLPEAAPWGAFRSVTRITLLACRYK